MKSRYQRTVFFVQWNQYVSVKIFINASLWNVPNMNGLFIRREMCEVMRYTYVYVPQLQIRNSIRGTNYQRFEAEIRLLFMRSRYVHLTCRCIQSSCCMFDCRRNWTLRRLIKLLWWIYRRKKSGRFIAVVKRYVKMAL